MRKPTAIALVVVLMVAVFGALAFAAPLPGARHAERGADQAERGADIPVCRSAQPNQTTEDTTTRAFHTAAHTTHDDAPRQAGRRMQNYPVTSSWWNSGARSRSGP